jgi:hypothetical protein
MMEKASTSGNLVKFTSLHGATTQNRDFYFRRSEKMEYHVSVNSTQYTDTISRQFISSSNHSL